SGRKCTPSTMASVFSNRSGPRPGSTTAQSSPGPTTRELPPGKPRRRRAIRESSSRSPRRLTSWRDIGWQESAGGQLLIDRRAVEYEVHGNRRPDRSGRFIDPAKGDRQNEEWKKGDRVVVCS